MIRSNEIFWAPELFLGLIMASVNEIRSKFLDYFVKEGHEEVPSSPLVPTNDPTLMFTNAGMVQFKNVFTGVEKRPYSTAVTSQKCVRAGGKHNDLDNVGFTARHLTFFEMLGNFSFGDYFKERAIELAWNLVVKEYGLPKERLLVTVYSEDDVAFNLWRKISGLSEDKIIPISTSDNFWSMGDVGPCGPCSEIFYDHGEEVFGGPPGSANEDGDRFVEIWNLVFMQYEQISKEKRVNLPHPSIDTGMGLERISAILQNKHDVYDIDLFKNIIGAALNSFKVDMNEENKSSFRVIADHLRSMSFLIAEGILPSNEGRGYVLRRIMRRAMRHATLLGVQEPIIHSLVPVLINEMGQHYPELIEAKNMISETILLEEGRFLQTLNRGLAILEEETANLKKGDMLDGQTAFKLYDTYGFPLDLTQDALRHRGINVDLAGFEDAMARQKEEARKNWIGAGGSATEKVWFEILQNNQPTEFLGYDKEVAQGEVLAIVKNGQQIDQLNEGESGFLLLNQTPFYAESGGQVGDVGQIVGEDLLVEVTNVTKQLDGLFVHHIEVKKGNLRRGMGLELRVDSKNRNKIRANHSATHLLHAALRQVLGKHVVQKGSLVDAERLRFDFAHTKAMSEEEINRVEQIANEMVLQNSEVTTRLMGIEEARKAGAMALFGEKYADEVRVVSMGKTINDEGEEDSFSMELCGGTHVKRTGDIGIICIIQESSIASAVRRIEALTGLAARQYYKEQEEKLKKLSFLFKSPIKEIVNRANLLVEEKKKVERELVEAKKKLAMGASNKNSSSLVKQVGKIKFLGRSVAEIAPKDLKALVDEGKRSLGSGIVAIATKNEGKGAIIVGVTNDLLDKFDAIKLVKIGSAIMGGKGGGGRPDMAQAGGPNGAKADEAIKAIEAELAKLENVRF